MEQKIKVLNSCIRLNIVLWVIIRLISSMCFLGGLISYGYYLNQNDISSSNLSLIVLFCLGIIIPGIYYVISSTLFYLAGEGFVFYLKEKE